MTGTGTGVCVARCARYVPDRSDGTGQHDRSVHLSGSGVLV